VDRGDDPIEFLAPAAWDDVEDDAVAGPSRPRWVIPSFVTVLALAVGGIAVGAATNDDRATRPTVVTQSTVTEPSEKTTLPTIAASTTLPEFPPPLFPPDQSTVDGSQIPKYVIDVPSGLNVVESKLTLRPPQPVPQELWAVPGSSARSGRWVTIGRLSGGASGRLVATDSYRLSLPGTEAAVAPPTATRPTTRLRIESNGDLIVAEAFGFDESQIPDLVSAIAANVDDLTLSEATADMRRLDGNGDNPLPYGGGNRYLNIVGPIPPDAATPRRTEIQLRVSLPAMDSRRLEAFRLTDIVRLPIGDDTAAVAGSLADQTGFGSVTWLDRDGWELQLTGTLPLEDLIALARTARVDEPLWDVFSTSASPRSPVSMTASDPSIVSSYSGTNGSGDVTLTPYVDTVSNTRWLTWSVDRSNGELIGFDFVGADAPLVYTAVVDGTTFVLASAPSSDAQLTLQVTLPTGEVSEAALKPGTFGPLELAAVAGVFNAPGQYSAVIVDESGNTVAAWPGAASG
jgi:hypothetical protein